MEQKRKIPPIINSRTIPYRDSSTLIWYKDQDRTNKKYKLWTGIVTSLSDYVKWCSSVPILAVVLFELPDADVPLLSQYRPNIPHLFVKQEVAKAQGLTNYYSIEALSKQYPIVSLDASTSPANTIAAIGLLFHFTQFVDIPCSPDWSTYVTSLNIRQATGIVPPSICLITQYFVHKITKRAKEFRQCLKNNLACDQIDRVVLLNETDLKYEWSSMRGSEKVDQVIIGTRLTYKDLLKYTYESVPSNTIVIYANADIYCTNTLTELYAVDMRDKLFALLRWDEQSGPEDLKLFGPRPDSQDAWIVHSDSIKSRTWDWSAFNYRLGTAGCDNRFTGDMFGMKFLVSNPCNSIKTVHIHKTEIRDYNRHDIIPAKLYLYIHPCPITYMDQSRTQDHKISKLAPRTTTVTIKSLNPKQAHTFVVMLAREKKYTWSHETPTVRTESAIEVSKLTNVFVGASGLLYDYKKTYLGPAEKSDPFITKSDIPFKTAFFSPCEQVESMLAIPAALRAYFTNPDLFCLYYLSYALQFYRAFPEINFGMYLPPVLQPLAQSFVMRPSSPDAIHAVAWSPDGTVYAKSAYGCLPDVFELSTNELTALRSAWPAYQPTATTQNCVVLTDTTLTEEFAASLAAIVGLPIVCVARTEYGLEAYTKIVGAKLCILFNMPKQDTDWMKLWCLPKGCPTLEFQNELKVVGEFQQFAAAAELDCWFMALHKGPIDDLQGQITTHVREWIKVNPFSS
jgi:hypothetical protein